MPELSIVILSDIPSPEAARTEVEELDKRLASPELSYYQPVPPTGFNPMHVQGHPHHFHISVPPDLGGDVDALVEQLTAEVNSMLKLRQEKELDRRKEIDKLRAPVQHQHEVAGIRLMLARNPDLVELAKADPQQFFGYWHDLQKDNATVMAGHLRRMMEFPHNAGAVILEARKAPYADD